MNVHQLVRNIKRAPAERLRYHAEVQLRLAHDLADLSALQKQLLTVLDRVDRGLEELRRLAAEDEA